MDYTVDNCSELWVMGDLYDPVNTMNTVLHPAL